MSLAYVYGVWNLYAMCIHIKEIGYSGWVTVANIIYFYEISKCKILNVYAEIPFIANV